MKFKFYQYFILFVLLTLISCKPEDKYYTLSEEASSLLVYEEGETFELKNEINQEVISLSVESKFIEFIEDGPNTSPMVGFGRSRDIYFEKAVITFSNSGNYRGQISVVAKRHGEYEFKIYLDGNFDEHTYSYPEYLGNVTINDVVYPDSYVLESYPNEIYYSKEKGILKIDNITEEITKFSIVE